MPKDTLEPDEVQLAFAKLQQAERCVDILRAMLAGAEPSTASHDAVLGWLKHWERAAFSRRLELDTFWKERRRHSRRVWSKPWNGVSYLRR